MALSVLATPNYAGMEVLRARRDHGASDNLNWQLAVVASRLVKTDATKDFLSKELWDALQVHILDWHDSLAYILDWHDNLAYILDWHDSLACSLGRHDNLAYILDWHDSLAYILDWHDSLACSIGWHDRRHQGVPFERAVGRLAGLRCMRVITT